MPADTLTGSLPNLPDHEATSKIIKIIAVEEILSRFKDLEDYEVSEKGSGEIVTDADTETEIRLSRELTALSPDSTVIGEEGFDKDKGIMTRFDGDAPVWVVDPLDGTRNFSQGKTCFCVIVAYCVKKTTYLGWIYDPINDDLYFAAKGLGAWCNNKPIKLNRTPKLSKMIGSVGKRRREQLNRNYGPEFPNVPQKFIRYRCIGLEYVDLVRGKIHFAEYHNLKPWDHAAGILLHQEAGGYSAYAKTLDQYVPGPISTNKFIATQDKKIWGEIHKFLSV